MGNLFIQKCAIVASLAGAGFATANNSTRTLNLQPEFTNGTVLVEHLSTHGNLDGFKMSTPAARKSADFWYFDVFSQSSNETLNVVFFNSGEFSQYPHPLAVQISGTFQNGTDFYYEALANDGVTITNGPSGVTGNWKGIGSFQGSSLDGPDITYSINIDSAEMEMSGNIEFQAIAPAHYPCDLNGAIGATQNLLPGLYWSNAIPDAKTTVKLQVKGVDIEFTDGVGYHDKNWGNQSIIDGPRYWDWGHGRFGPYSVVWYNLLDYKGKESRRSFVVEDGEVLMVSCDLESMVVRQRGGKAAWPPTTGLLGTEGLTVQYNLPDGETLAVNITTELIVRDESGAYQRGNGLISGGIVGKETFQGKAHYEEFIFGIVNNYEPQV